MGDDNGLYLSDIYHMTTEEAEAMTREDEAVAATLRISSTRNLFGYCGLQLVGDGSAPLDVIAQMLLQKDMLDESGGVLNCPEASLKGETSNGIYFLGLNPGGAAPEDQMGLGTVELPPEDEAARRDHTTIYENLAMCRLGVSGWDQNWSRAGATYSPGMAPLQRRFKHVARHLGISYTEIVATNLTFIRSTQYSELTSVKEQIQDCLPVHEYLMGLIKPKRLWMMGNPAHARDVLELTSQEWLTDSTHRNWGVGRGTAKFCGHDLEFCHTPHLSRWDVTAPERQKFLDFAFGPTPSLS